MRSRKNAVPVPVTRDLLQEKQTEVARLARQASEAVDIVTRTMNELEGTLPQWTRLRHLGMTRSSFTMLCGCGSL